MCWCIRRAARTVHELCACQPLSPTCCTLGSLLPPRSATKPARHARGVGCMQRRSTLLCACYWSDTRAPTCLLPAAAELLQLILRTLHHALADAQHLLDLEARHRLILRCTRPSSSPRSRVSLHPEASLHSEAVQRALRVRSHTGIPQRQPSER